MPGVDVAPVPEPTNDRLTIPVLPGPRLDWFDDDAWGLLTSQTYSVTSESD